MSRPGAFYVHGGPVVVVPGRVARALWKFAHVDAYRDHVRGQDVELDEVLEAIRLAGIAWAGSVSATDQGKAAEPRRDWFTTQEAAQLVGISDSGIRKAIREGRLKADRNKKPQTIAAEDLAHFRAARKGRAA